MSTVTEAAQHPCILLDAFDLFEKKVECVHVAAQRVQYLEKNPGCPRKHFRVIEFGDSDSQLLFHICDCGK